MPRCDNQRGVTLGMRARVYISPLIIPSSRGTLMCRARREGKRAVQSPRGWFVGEGDILTLAFVSIAPMFYLAVPRHTADAHAITRLARVRPPEAKSWPGGKFSCARARAPIRHFPPFASPSRFFLGAIMTRKHGHVHFSCTLFREYGRENTILCTFYHRR